MEPTMIAADLEAWRAHMGWSRVEASRQLGIAPNRWTAMEHGRTRIPRYIALACMALAAGLPAWPAVVQA